MKGLFISFEGPEGSGKTTQISRLASKLRAQGIEVVTTREPGGTKTGELIREILQHNLSGEHIYEETEILLFAASRAQHVRSVVQPALERGACVLSDRFLDSTIAYQGFGRGMKIPSLEWINKYAVAGIIPEMTFLLDLAVEEGLERIHKRNRMIKMDGIDRMESEGLSFHKAVRTGYLKIARKNRGRFRIIHASQEMDKIEDQIWKQIKGVCKKKYDVK